ncbi:hypothetical protein [Streptomyces sp. NPDC047981]|uniref:hypothetical protein n=1 Tax=Streptomyces sp. NPDC047981 TaxID=3154610 RepID=UPI00343FF647
MALVMGLVLTGCASPSETAGADARQTCENLGYNDASESADEDSSGNATDTWSAGKWAEVAEDLDEEVNRAARAARADRSWDRLSNAVTDFQRLTELKATIENTSLPQADRDAAQAQHEALNGPEVVRAMEQECRKALAD